MAAQEHGFRTIRALSDGVYAFVNTTPFITTELTSRRFMLDVIKLRELAETSEHPITLNLGIQFGAVIIEPDTSIVGIARMVIDNVRTQIDPEKTLEQWTLASSFFIEAQQKRERFEMLLVTDRLGERAERESITAPLKHEFLILKLAKKETLTCSRGEPPLEQESVLTYELNYNSPEIVSKNVIDYLANENFMSDLVKLRQIAETDGVHKVILDINPGKLTITGETTISDLIKASIPHYLETDAEKEHAAKLDERLQELSAEARLGNRAQGFRAA